MQTFSFNDVTKITLLSEEEASGLPKWILSSSAWWWLRSPGNFKHNITGVSFSGSIDYNGYYVDSDDYGVRPALTIESLDSFNLEIGETVKVGNCIAQYIGNNKVLLCEPICNHRFDKESNDYGQSEIKKFIEDWLIEKKLKITPRIAKINTKEELGKVYNNFIHYCDDTNCFGCKYYDGTEIGCFMNYLFGEE